eukprot:1157653-Pelagomonas_calceolata.AAC.2
MQAGMCDTGASSDVGSNVGRDVGRNVGYGRQQRCRQQCKVCEGGQVILMERMPGQDKVGKKCASPQNEGIQTLYLLDMVPKPKNTPGLARATESRCCAGMSRPP